MIVDDEFEYRSYRVHCYAKAVSSGRFTAGLVITRVTPDRVLERHFPQIASFASKREAFEHARAVGMAWIDAREPLPASASASTSVPELAPASVNLNSHSVPTPLSPPSRSRRPAPGLRSVR